MPGEDLYKLCPICAGSGTCPMRGAHYLCAVCNGKKFVKTGLTLAQVDGLVARSTAREIVRLKAELGEWWRAAVALNDAADDDAERAARSRIDSLRTGSSWSHVPESVAELMGEQNTRLTAEVARLRAALVGIRDKSAARGVNIWVKVEEIEADASAALSEVKPC